MSQDLFWKLQRVYKHNSEAEALSFKDKDGRSAFRLVIPGLDLEFTAGFYIGRHPKWRFYYNNDLQDIVKQSQPTAKYTVESTSVDWKVYANIKLYKSDSKPPCTPYAEFLASDPRNLTAGSKLIGLLDLTGKWKKQTYSRSSAIVEKATDTSKITVTSSVIHKKGKLTTDSSSFNKQKDRIKVNGTLYLKDTDGIDSAHYARWYSDHIVFYDNDYAGRDFSGFFFPLELKKSDDETNLGSETDKVFKGVTWSRV